MPSGKLHWRAHACATSKLWNPGTSRAPSLQPSIPHRTPSFGRPYAVIYRWEWYRIPSAAFTHGGFLHILMNMLATFQMSVTIERAIGSMALFGCQFLFITLIGIMYCFCYWVAYKSTVRPFYSVLISANEHLSLESAEAGAKKT